MVEFFLLANKIATILIVLVLVHFNSFDVKRRRYEIGERKITKTDCLFHGLTS